nr:unnamed protein product [Digitaria exilis]
MSPPRPHFLVLTFPLQGHITPALRLARRLLSVAPDVLPHVPGQRRADHGAEEEDDGRLELLPFSDGTDSWEFRSSDVGAFDAYMSTFHAAVARSVAEIVDALAARGRPVTRVVYTLMLPWAADVARDRGVPSALYWIQPASVLAIYHHYFHGHDAGVVAEHRHDPAFVVGLPGLAPLTIRDLPSFLTESTEPSDTFHSIFTTVRDLIETLDKERPRATVLVNTCRELEVGALAALGGQHDVLPVGPVLPSGSETGIFKHDDAKYMEWLDAKPENSVAYVSFGSLATMGREQLDELLLGLEESERPYLCVIRKDIKAALAGAEADEMPQHERVKNGMVVEWCDQWGASVLESVATGVPMVCVPRLSDQRMNAQLVAREWRVGVRAQVDEGGVLRAPELRRCIDAVMDNSEAAAEVRRMAKKWKLVVTEALCQGGSSEHNLVAFVDGARSNF